LIKIPYPDGISFDHAVYNDIMMNRSFTDFSLEGEQMWPQYKPGMRNVAGIMTVDLFRAHFMNLNYGRVGNWDPKLGNQPHTTRRAQRAIGPSICQHMSSFVMLHDVSFHLWSYSFPNEHLAPLKNALIRNGWGPQYVMIPYWDQKIVEMPANMYATFYVDPGDGPKPKTIDSTGYYCRSVDAPPKKVICIFSNESDYAGEVRIRPEWKKLGFKSPEGVTAENAVHRFTINYLDAKAKEEDGFIRDDQYELVEDPNEYARIENGELVFPMTEWNYRMIVLEQKEE
jgi:hypothetical protein